MRQIELLNIGYFYISETYKLYREINGNVYELTNSGSCQTCALYKNVELERFCFETCRETGGYYKRTSLWNYDEQKFNENVKIVLEFSPEVPQGTTGTVAPASVPNIIRPNHYKMTINGQTIEVMDILKAILTPEEMRGFNKGNIIKYILRERNKNGIADIKKCKQYAEFMLGDEE